MATESALVILHLSDLHFTGPDKGHYWNSAESTERELPAHDQKGLLGRLLDDPILADNKPQLVVVSGDLLDKADPSGVKPAIEFLSGLADKLSLPRERFSMVPGNHDVSWDPKVSCQHFDEIYQGFYGSARPGFAGKPGHERADLFDYPTLNVTIAGFNSAEGLDATHPDGSVSEAQRKALEKKLASVDKRPLRIAVMHHHLEQPEHEVKRATSVMTDPQSVKKWLREKGFSLVLHGHEHVDWQTTVEIDDWRLTIVAAGSLGVGKYGREDWLLPLSYQLIVVSNAREGFRVRREYDPRSHKWGEARSGDGKNRPTQRLRFGSLRGNVETSPRDSRRFVSAFDALLTAAPKAHRAVIRSYRDDAAKGSPIDLCKLCKDLCGILDLLPGRDWRGFAEAAKKLICRVVLDVPLSADPSALPPIRLFAGELEAVPVATHLYLALLAAHAQGVDSVDLGYDSTYGVVGGDGLSPGFTLTVAPTATDAWREFEKVLWDELRPDETVNYDPKCDCPPIECQEHRMLGDRREKCNELCCRFRLYAEIEGRSENGHRVFGVVEPSSDKERAAWSAVARNITSVSLLCFGGKGIGTGPPDENKVHFALKTFFEKTDRKQGKRASR